MKQKRALLIILLLVGFIGIYTQFIRSGHPLTFSLSKGIVSDQKTDNNEDGGSGLLKVDEGQSLHPLTIESLRNTEFPGSDIIIEQVLDAGSNYSRQLVSFTVDGLKEYALLTIPNGERPQNGYPAIVFNHGYIPPAEYRTTERYIAYIDGFARNGFVVIKPDYRGHGSSEGSAEGAYGSGAYVRDVLSVFASLQKMKVKNQVLVDPKRMGMWGHSMGGYITLRSMVVNPSIRAGVIWAGVVGSYEDIVYNWRRLPSVTPNVTPSGVRRWRQELIDLYGAPTENPEFWNSISATSYLKDISGPVQLHHGDADSSVPVAFSQKLNDRMKQVDKEVELYTYVGDDHNISGSFNLAMERSIQFFKEHLQ